MYSSYSTSLLFAIVNNNYTNKDASFFEVWKELIDRYNLGKIDSDIFTAMEKIEDFTAFIDVFSIYVSSTDTTKLLTDAAVCTGFFNKALKKLKFAQLISSLDFINSLNFISFCFYTPSANDIKTKINEILKTHKNIDNPYNLNINAPVSLYSLFNVMVDNALQEMIPVILNSKLTDDGKHLFIKGIADSNCRDKIPYPEVLLLSYFWYPSGKESMTKLLLKVCKIVNAKSCVIPNFINRDVLFDFLALVKKNNDSEIANIDWSYYFMGSFKSPEHRKYWTNSKLTRKFNLVDVFNSCLKESKELLALPYPYSNIEPIIYFDEETNTFHDSYFGIDADYTLLDFIDFMIAQGYRDKIDLNISIEDMYSLEEIFEKHPDSKEKLSRFLSLYIDGPMLHTESLRVLLHDCLDITKQYISQKCLRALIFEYAPIIIPMFDSTKNDLKNLLSLPWRLNDMLIMDSSLNYFSVINSLAEACQNVYKECSEIDNLTTSLKTVQISECSPNMIVSDVCIIPGKYLKLYLPNGKVFVTTTQQYRNLLKIMYARDQLGLN